MSHMFDDSNDDLYKLHVPTLPKSTATASSSSNKSMGMSSSALKAEKAIYPTDIKEIILHLKVKYNHPAVHNFIEEELTCPKKAMKVNGQEQSVLQLYTLHILNDPIDMSNQTVRRIYRPTLFIRKNDAFGPFNHYYLLNLFDIEYERPNQVEFPDVWKTTDDTNVIVNIIQLGSARADTTISTTEVNGNIIENDTTTLIGMLRAICRENKYNEEDANAWFECLKMENINTIDHLRSITKDDWDKLTRITHVVKQLIRDYMEINNAITSFNQNSDPYKDSTATLFGDIHRVKRYFYYVIKKLDLIPYLSRKAVDLAIDEVRKTYDDDGNILVNIQTYLRTFCLKKNDKDKDEVLYRQNQRQWADEIRQLKQEQTTSDQETKRCRTQLENLKRDLETTEKRTNTMIQREVTISNTSSMASNSTHQTNSELFRRNQEANQIKDYYTKRNEAIKELERVQKEHAQQNERYVASVAKASNFKKQIESLEQLMQLEFDAQHKKLEVKYGRGLLLYGPPGTGKSELLKRVAIYAGITMITQPLAAGELNRPYVGETEKLLVDIMYRANAIPFLICAMTIDEIDGLVPKRDNNAQQGKVDGISVLLSHIEGVKNIPNLIVFGATNRRNMMDEAFLRRMQAKVFVGRPSPAIRNNMVTPLVCKDSRLFTSKRLESLVKITTNFSGAAISALRSNLIIEMDGNPNITDHRLLELADSVSREFNVWFGISTLPEICRLNPTIMNSTHHENNYSLEFEKLIPTGRILIDYNDRKCLIEMKNEPTLEKDLEKDETSVPGLLARFIHGCSTRNIDTMQTIDLNFLIKQNAFDENQIFELLTTTFLECNEYNRSMLIFDIDSLIMLSKSDSDMSKSKSISNIRVYQFIREKCKTSIVQQTEPNDKGIVTKIEKWIVMIVKDPWLRNTLIDDIEFKKSTAQLNKEQEKEDKRIDDERSRKCPKCLRNYTPKEARDGNCHYHSAFIVDINQPKERLTSESAQAILQSSILHKLSEEEMPKLIWACCLRRYGDSLQSCETGKCGLPTELEGKVNMNDENYISIVQEHFKKNPSAEKNLNKFLEMYKSATTIRTNSRSTAPITQASKRN